MGSAASSIFRRAPTRNDGPEFDNPLLRTLSDIGLTDVECDALFAAFEVMDSDFSGAIDVSEVRPRAPHTHCARNNPRLSSLAFSVAMLTIQRRSSLRPFSAPSTSTMATWAQR